MTIFKNINFVSVLTVRLLTNIGDSLFYIVTLWFISLHAGSSIYTGLAVFLFTLPEALLIFVGPFIDRYNPKYFLLISTCGQIIVLLLIVLGFMSGFLPVSFLLVLIFCSAFLSAITYPIEDTMLPQMVAHYDLVKANSIFQVLYKIFDALFDGIAGILLSIFAAIYLYQMNLLVFFLPLIALKFLKFNMKDRPDETFSFALYRRELGSGLHFIWHSDIKFMLLPLVFVNFFNAINAVALPYFAASFQQSAATYGMLMACTGIGGLIGAMMINKIKDMLSPGKILVLGILLDGVFWLAMVLSVNVWMAYAFIFLTGMCMGVYNVIFASLFQVMTPVSLLGKVNTTVDSMITMAMPIGGFIGGLFITFIPLPVVMGLFSASMIITSIVYFKNKRIYHLKKIEEITPLGEHRGRI